MDDRSLDQAELQRLEAEMKRLVDANMPFLRREIPVAEAIAYFEKENYPDKVSLLRHRRKPYVTLYSIGEHMDYHHGYMVPTTGYLKVVRPEPSQQRFHPALPAPARPHHHRAHRRLSQADGHLPPVRGMAGTAWGLTTWEP